MDIIQLALIRILSYPYRKLCVFHIAPDLEQNRYIFRKHFLKVTHLSVVTQIILEEKKNINGWSCSHIFVHILYNVQKHYTLDEMYANV